MSQTLVNGTPAPARRLDGKAETVYLKRLTIRELYIVTEHMIAQRMPAIVALCYSKSEEWVDELTDESFGDLAQRAVALNFPRAMTMSNSDPVMALKIAPLMTALAAVEVQAQTLIAGQPSKTSSPVPSPSDSAGAIGNASST